MSGTYHIDELDGPVTLFKSTDEGTETIAVFDEEHREVIQELLAEILRLKIKRDGFKRINHEWQRQFAELNITFTESGSLTFVEESKEVYRHMDRVVFGYANTLTTPDNLRAELEMEAGETEAGPHYIVAAYPRPGAVWTHLVMNHIKDLQAKNKTKTIEPEELISFYPWLMSSAGAEK